jgi:hypothetical protein
MNLQRKGSKMWFNNEKSSEKNVLLETPDETEDCGADDQKSAG